MLKRSGQFEENLFNPYCTMLETFKKCLVAGHKVIIQILTAFLYTVMTKWNLKLKTQYHLH